MDDYLKQALEIVKAQASVRIMSEEEITSMVKNLSHHLRNLEELPIEQEEPAPLTISPAKSIKEKTITCLECGKSFKIITKKHLMTHNLDADSYREKWGIKKTIPLVCKELQRERRKKMREMKLWEKRSAEANKKRK
jgi:predicted transcriptional regulator